MCKQLLRTIVFPVALILVHSTGLAQQQRPPDLKLDASTNREVIEGVLKAIRKYYVSPQTGQRIDEIIRRRLNNGEYDKISSAFDLVHVLDDQLQEISGDKHIYLGYSYELQALDEHPEVDTPEDKEGELRNARAENFGFQKIERLPGNIGYLDVRRFDRPEFSGETVGAAMTALANTDALVIDLRNNRGGSPVGMIFMASYFFDSEPVHLRDMFFRTANPAQHRPENTTVQYWTYPYLPGKRYLGKDVYILTSKRTWSAAEAFSKILQGQKRAVVVGESTRGGTNPGLFITIHPHFAVFVPIGRPVNVDNEISNAEGGVKPDIAVPADQALKRAQLEALNKKLNRVPDQKAELEPIINVLKKELEALSPKP